MNIIFDYENSGSMICPAEFHSAKGVCHVINRKKYCTDTADLLWKKECDRYIIGAGQKQHYGVALFRKKNGEYFKYYVEWKYRDPVITIKPLKEEEAKDLTEKFVPDLYIDIFGDVEE